MTGEDVDVVAVVPLWVGTVGEAAGTAADGEVAGVGVDVTGFGLAAGDDVGCGAADVAVARVGVGGTLVGAEGGLASAAGVVVVSGAGGGVVVLGTFVGTSAADVGPLDDVPLAGDGVRDGWVGPEAPGGAEGVAVVLAEGASVTGVAESVVRPLGDDAYVGAALSSDPRSAVTRGVVERAPR